MEKRQQCPAAHQDQAERSDREHAALLKDDGAATGDEDHFTLRRADLAPGGNRDVVDQSGQDP
jgi:hypothetical protein